MCSPLIYVKQKQDAATDEEKKQLITGVNLQHIFQLFILLIFYFKIIIFIWK